MACPAHVCWFGSVLHRSCTALGNDRLRDLDDLSVDYQSVDDLSVDDQSVEDLSVDYQSVDDLSVDDLSVEYLSGLV